MVIFKDKYAVMKSRHFLFLLPMVFATVSWAQQYTVGTYNLRYRNSGDTGNMWEQREPVIASLIRFHDFDILGTQEGLIGMLEDLSRDLPEYARYGIGRDDGKDGGEHSEIFFKKDKFTLLRHGDFWLSQTPGKPSLGWDATCCNRICSWVQLQDKKTKRKFYVFDTHYDYQKDLARNESSKLILEKIKTIAGDSPVIFMGDLNGSNDAEWYKRIAGSGILQDTYRKASHPYGDNPSFQDFGKLIAGSEVIDHIFVTRGFSVYRWGILSDTYHGKYPSDHFPILTKLVLH
jgi:endonuclease/exonuclease/phosphatase family metal-dependent hydrolase